MDKNEFDWQLRVSPDKKMNENLKKWQSSIRPNDKRKLVEIKDLFDWPFGFVRPIK